MLFPRRGALIPDEAPNDVGGTADTTAKADDGSDVVTDADATKNKADKTKDGTSDDAANNQKKTDDKTSTSKKEDDDANGDGEGTDNDELTKASAAVAKKYRGLKTENAGLKDRIETLSEIEEENKRLKAEIAKEKEGNIKLKLAGKYGLNPKMLERVSGTEEEIETWIREYTENSSADVADKKSDDGKKTDAGTDKKSDDNADKGDDADKSDKSTKGKVKDIDGNRPDSAKEKASMKDLSVEQIRERAFAKL